MTPTLVLTRPEAQSRALAATLGDGMRVIVSPVMKISGTGVVPDLSGYAGVILTSATAVPFAPDLAGRTAHCVGSRTADAAREAGARIGVVARDAEHLVGSLDGNGPFLHLRGEHARGAAAERLTSAGIETVEAVIYRQEALPLTVEARAAIEGADVAVVPLYSPRSARLVGDGVTHVGPNVRAIAMSAAVADAWLQATGRTAEICDEPTGAAMRDRIECALRE